jgi:hypothetical protein
MSGLTALVSGGPPLVGQWTIETGVAGDGSVAAFDRLAREMVTVFLASFHDLAWIDRGAVDLMWLAPDGRVTRVAETVPVAVDEVDGLVVPDDPTLVAAVFLHCPLCMRTDSGSQLHDNGLHFYYGCVIEYDEADRARPLDSAVTVTISVDVWSGPTGMVNRSLLTAALRDWESRTGKPITEWESHGAYRGRVGRYGFSDSP